MAQVLALTVYTRAYELTGDKHYLAVAEKILNIFSVPTEDGGVLKKYSQDEYCYKEYPQHRYNVLDGFLVSLCDLLEYYYATGDARAKALLDKGLNYLVIHYKDFTPSLAEGGGVYYSTMGTFPDKGYYCSILSYIQYLSSYDNRLNKIYSLWERVNNNFYYQFYRSFDTVIKKILFRLSIINKF